MGIKDDFKTARSIQRLSEEEMYALAVEEMETGERRPGLWGKAFSESDGDVDRAKARYIKLRVQALYDEAHLAERLAQEQAEKERERAIQERHRRRTASTRVTARQGTAEKGKSKDESLRVTGVLFLLISTFFVLLALSQQQ